MLNITNFIFEKLKINSQSKINNTNFTDEELMSDYILLIKSYSIKEKQQLAEKYRCSSLNAKNIQSAILDELRENRQSKTEFTKNDIIYFLRYDIPENRFITYLKQEPKEFVEYLLEYYKKLAVHINPRPGLQTDGDKFILKRIAKIQKYLGHQ